METEETLTWHVGGVNEMTTTASPMNTSYKLFVNYSLQMSDFEAYLSGFLMALTISLTVVGNVIVILSISTQNPLHAVQNYFLVSLAVADLTVGVFVMPLSASYYFKGYWSHGLIVCDIWRTLDVCLCTASILNLCAIALDRYWAITDPINYAPKRTRKRICSVIIFVWVLSFLISVPPLLGWDDLRTNPKGSSKEFLKCTLSQQQGYIILSSTTSFYIPFLVMCVVYLRIYNSIRVRGRSKPRALYRLAPLPDRAKQSSSNKEEPFEASCAGDDEAESSSPRCLNPNSNVAPDLSSDIEITFRKKRKELLKINIKKERRAARTLGIILGAFIVCWLPFFLMYVIMPFCKYCQHPGIRVEAAITWIGYVNSACNPIVYTIFNREFRSAFFTLLFGKCVRYHRRIKHEKILTKAASSSPR